MTKDRPNTRDQYMTGTDSAAALTRLELGIIRAYGALSRWAVELHKHVGGQQMPYSDVALLHTIRMRGGSPTFPELLLFLNRMDISNVQYSLRKLEKLGLVTRTRGGTRRDTILSITDESEQLTEDFGAVRDEVLVHLCDTVEDFENAMNDAASALERLAGIYDQATTSILNEVVLKRED